MVGLNGQDLTLQQIRSVARHREGVEITAEARASMLRSRAVVERLAAGNDAVYGVNTGVGAPLGTAEVRAMMLIRANVLAKGFSGIRPEIAELLCEMLNRALSADIEAVAELIETSLLR